MIFFLLIIDPRTKIIILIVFTHFNLRSKIKLIAVFYIIPSVLYAFLILSMIHIVFILYWEKKLEDCLIITIRNRHKRECAITFNDCVVKT